MSRGHGAPGRDEADAEGDGWVDAPPPSPSPPQDVPSHTLTDTHGRSGEDLTVGDTRTTGDGDDDDGGRDTWATVARGRHIGDHPGTRYDPQPPVHHGNLGREEKLDEGDSEVG